LCQGVGVMLGCENECGSVLASLPRAANLSAAPPPATTASLLLAFGLVKWPNQLLHAAANEIGQFGLNACLTDPALSCLIKLTSLVHPLLSHVPPSV
jgi:hypothetical protein